MTPRNLLLVLLAALLGANLFVRPHHPHVAAESLFGFWAVFGLAGGLALCLAAGALGRAARLKEDSHGR